MVDITRLYTAKSYSRKFNIPYPTVYAKLVASLSNRTKTPFLIHQIGECSLIFVSPEEEVRVINRLKEKAKAKLERG